MQLPNFRLLNFIYRGICQLSLSEVIYMAATPKGPQKMKLDFNVDRATYDQFIRMCAQRGYAPQIVIEKLMTKFVQTGQM